MYEWTSVSVRAKGGWTWWQDSRCERKGEQKVWSQGRVKGGKGEEGKEGEEETHGPEKEVGAGAHLILDLEDDGPQVHNEPDLKSEAPTATATAGAGVRAGAGARVREAEVGGSRTRETPRSR